MDLTNEQKAQIDAQLDAHIKSEEARRTHEAIMDKRRAKLELIRLAKDALTENARNKPVGEGDISADDVIEFAERLIAYIDA